MKFKVRPLLCTICRSSFYPTQERLAQRLRPGGFVCNDCRYGQTQQTIQGRRIYR